MRRILALFLCLMTVGCGHRGGPPAQRTPSSSIQSNNQNASASAQLAVATELVDWYMREQESGVALTPLFIELRDDAMRQFEMSGLNASSSRADRIDVAVSGLALFKAIADILYRANAQDITRVQMVQANSDISQIQAILESVKAGTESTEALSPSLIIVDVKLSNAMRLRSDAAHELSRLSELWLAETSSIEHWKAAVYIDSVRNVAAADRLLVNNQEAIDTAARDRLKSFDDRLTLAWSDRVSEGARRWSKYAQFASRRMPLTDRPQMGSVHNWSSIDELAVYAQHIRSVFGTSWRGAEPFPMNWLIFRTYRRSFEWQVRASQNIEVRMSAAENYLNQVTDVAMRTNSEPPETSDLAKGLSRYFIADAEFERLLVGYERF